MDPSLKIACIGAGYVGGPTMAVIAEKCPNITVTVMDVNQARIDAWNSDTLPIYEPGLEEIVMGVRDKNLFFTTDPQCLKEASIIFMAVNTPTKTKGLGKGYAADLKYVEGCSRLIADTVTEGHKIIVEKSTVPVRCSVIIRKILAARTSGTATFSILSNPEFLAEGTAIQNLISPDRVLIGHEKNPIGIAAANSLASVYATWLDSSKILFTNLWSSELSKLAANAFLAQRISSVNAISSVCEATGADVTEVTKAIGMDSRLGPHFLSASVGFGGSCFQKDILNLVYLCESLNLHEEARYWNMVVSMNNHQRARFANRIIHDMFDTIGQKTIAIFGFTFKKETSDTRESSAIMVCSRLLEEGAILNIYDPKATEQMILMELEYFNSDAQVQQAIKTNVHIVDSALEATKGASAIVVLTEWPEFATTDYKAHYNQMLKPPFIFDGRLIIDEPALKEIGFNCFTVGRPVAPEEFS